MLASELQTRTLRLLNEDTTTPAFYSADEVLAAINVAHRAFAFLTLCLEAVFLLPLTAGQRYYRMLQIVADYIVPLRVTLFDSTATAPAPDVPPTGPALGVGCNNPPPAVVGVFYSHLFLAAGGTPPYTFSIVSGALPAGLTLDPATGLVTGFPTSSGPTAFTVGVTDSA